MSVDEDIHLTHIASNACERLFDSLRSGIRRPFRWNSDIGANLRVGALLSYLILNWGFDGSSLPEHNAGQ